MSDPQSKWNLSGSLARLTTERLQATINVCRPDLGLGDMVFRSHGKPVAWKDAQLLGVASGSGRRAEIQPLDAYVRVDDLVVSWQSITAADVHLQVYWRVLADLPSGASGIETIISAQTDLLDSDPTTRVGSQLPAGEMLWVSADDENAAGESVPLGQQLAAAPQQATPLRDALLIRMASGQASYLEMVYPGDNGGATVSNSDGRLKTDYAVLTERLEKGVIRRSRLQGLILPRENDLSLARELYRQFIASAPPLTT